MAAKIGGRDILAERGFPPDMGPGFKSAKVIARLKECGGYELKVSKGWHFYRADLSEWIPGIGMKTYYICFSNGVTLFSPIYHDKSRAVGVPHSLKWFLFRNKPVTCNCWKTGRSLGCWDCNPKVYPEGKPPEEMEEDDDE